MISTFCILVQKYVKNGRVLIFSQTKADCRNIMEQIKMHNYEAESMNGDVVQAQRERTLQNFINLRT